MTWREHEEELTEMERAKEDGRRVLAAATEASEAQLDSLIAHMGNGAPGGPGRSELGIVDSSYGHSVHLWDRKGRAVLCSSLKNTGRIVLPQVPFEVAGCIRCAREAVKRGYTYIVDIDGTRVELEVFRPYYKNFH